MSASLTMGLVHVHEQPNSSRADYRSGLPAVLLVAARCACTRCARGCPGARRGRSIPASGFVCGDAGKARLHC
jgi:hypothetical protein